ncbi:MAG: glycosyltransferase family 4 protein [Atopobiaceae bacterium]
MRILNITAQKPDSTGSGIYLSEMVRSEVALGHRTAVICGINAGDGVSSLPGETQIFPVTFKTEELPFPVAGMSDTMPYEATRYRDFTEDMTERFERAFVSAIATAQAEFCPDLVICHHLYLVSALARETVASCPVVAICHSTDLRQLAQHPLERERIERDMRKMDRIYALHEAQKEAIERNLGVPSEKISVIGTGYNAHIFNEEPPAPRRDSHGIVYAGKIWKKKGVLSLMHALALMPEHAVSVHLAGGSDRGAEELEIRKAASACNQDVVFLGKLPQADLAREYRKASVFVLPSFYEGLPLVLIEALASGAKAVVTDLPGIRPWLESQVDGAPVWWVEPPRLRNLDEPVPEDLPSFEERLAEALEEALAAPASACDVTNLSWDSLTERVLLDFPIDM